MVLSSSDFSSFLQRHANDKFPPAKAIAGHAYEYADLIWSESSAVNLDPCITVALGGQESAWGYATGKYNLDVQGPSGRGDWGARPTSASAPKPGGVIVSTLPAGWWDAGGKGGPWMLPADLRGYGCGLLQLDWFMGPAQQVDWADPQANIHAALALYVQKMNYIASKVQLAQNDLLAATTSAYNHGESAVVKWLLAGQDSDGGESPGYGTSLVMPLAMGLRAAMDAGQ